MPTGYVITLETSDAIAINTPALPRSPLSRALYWIVLWICKGISTSPHPGRSLHSYCNANSILGIDFNVTSLKPSPFSPTSSLKIYHWLDLFSWRPEYVSFNCYGFESPLQWVTMYNHTSNHTGRITSSGERLLAVLEISWLPTLINPGKSH